MICGQLLAATEIILALQAHPRLPQVILFAEPTLVEMTLQNFSLPWRIVRAEDNFTVVIRNATREALRIELNNLTRKAEGRPE